MRQLLNFLAAVNAEHEHLSEAKHGAHTFIKTTTPEEGEQS